MVGEVAREEEERRKGFGSCVVLDETIFVGSIPPFRL